MKIEISLPNDYGCEAAEAAMLEAVYHGEEPQDGGEAAYELLAAIAHRWGLEMYTPVAHGVIWEGSALAVAATLASLPAWAWHSLIED